MSDIICLCKGVTEETIIKAIKEGATTLDAVKEATGAMTGFCHGSRCTETIKALIETHKA